MCCSWHLDITLCLYTSIVLAVSLSLSPFIYFLAFSLPPHFGTASAKHRVGSTKSLAFCTNLVDVSQNLAKFRPNLGVFRPTLCVLRPNPTHAGGSPRGTFASDRRIATRATTCARNRPKVRPGRRLHTVTCEDTCQTYPPNKFRVSIHTPRNDQHSDMAPPRCRPCAAHSRLAFRSHPLGQSACAFPKSGRSRPDLGRLAHFGKSLPKLGECGPGLA